MTERAGRFKHRLRRALRAGWGRGVWMRDRLLGPPRGRPLWTILAGHEVGSGNPHLGPEMRISAAALERRIAWLRARAELLPVGAALRLVARGEARRPLVSLSFDDAYRGVQAVAAPLLRRLGVRATLYVHTGTWGGTWLPWTDLFLLLADRIGFQRLAEELAPLGCRGATLRALKSGLKLHGDPQRRDELLLALFGEHVGSLEEWAGQIYLRPDELSALEDVFEIGAHGVHHERLGSCDHERLECELGEPRQRLEALLGHPVAGFAFPFGRREDLPVDAAADLLMAGYSHACTMIEGANAGGIDPLALRRWPLEERFSSWELQSILHGRLRARIFRR